MLDQKCMSRICEFNNLYIRFRRKYTESSFWCCSNKWENHKCRIRIYAESVWVLSLLKTGQTDRIAVSDKFSPICYTQKPPIWRCCCFFISRIFTWLVPFFWRRKWYAVAFPTFSHSFILALSFIVLHGHFVWDRHYCVRFGWEVDIYSLCMYKCRNRLGIFGRLNFAQVFI